MGLLIIFLWLASGIASFIYWYTKDSDLTVGDLLSYSILGLLGPFVFILGWCIYTDMNIFRHTLIKKKRK